MKPTRIITLTGPECTGKTVLSKELAHKLECPRIPEYSVEYLEKLSGKYRLQDLAQIALEQKQRIDHAAEQSELIVVDTACLVLKVWAEVRFEEVPTIIEQWWQTSEDYNYLLCSPDLPWEPGPHRENPEDREELFDLYREHLWEMDRNFAVINGRNRLSQAMDFLRVSGCI